MENISIKKNANKSAFPKKTSFFYELDLSIIITSALFIACICIFFFLYPTKTNDIFAIIKPIFGDTFSIVYLAVNFIIFITAIFLAFSKYGNIVLGDKNEKPTFSFFTWGAMMFCCGMAADILYYGMTEWLLYMDTTYINSFDNPIGHANAYSFFYWANFWEYLVIGVCFAFMIHVRKRTRQRYSESLRPLLGKMSDGIIGKIVDIFSTVVIIAAVACSLSFTTPIITNCLNNIFGIPKTNITTIIILIIICTIYSISLQNGLKGIGLLSNICIYVFLFFIFYVLLFGGKTQFILESTINQIGIFLDQLINMFTYIDPLRKDTFTQDFGSFYNAFWLTWAIAVPFFIGIISKGRTIKEVILGGLAFATPGSIMCFSILANYSEGLELINGIKLIDLYHSSGDAYTVIMEILNSLPFSKIIQCVLVLSMICFNATSFDSISLTCSYYSYKNLTYDQKPNKWIKQFWAILLILFPVALVFSEGTFYNLQNVAVIFGFPAAILIILVIISFFKDANEYIKQDK